MVLLLALAGVSEGLGVATLIPMLESVQSTPGDQSAVGAAFDNLIRGVGLEPTLPLLLVLICGAILAKAVFRWFAMLQVGYTVAGVGADLRLRFVHALMGARWDYFGKRPIGALAQSLNNEVQGATAGYRQACEIIAASFPILAYLTYAMAVSWRVSLAALVAGGILLVFLRRFLQSARVASRAQVESAQALAGRIVGIIQGLKPVRAMAKEERVLPLIHRDVEEFRQAQVRGIQAREHMVVFQEPAITALLAVAIYVLSVFSGQPLSSLIVLAFVFYRLLTHINTVQKQYQMLVVSESSFASLMRQIDAAERSRERVGDGVAVGPLEIAITVDSVGFAYDTATPVLRDVTLSVPAGDFVAIIGESGSGKTTLMDLIVGLRTPDSGRILIDGTDLQEVDLLTWRRQIGYVPQEMLLLNDTVAGNVTLGDPELTEADVERALRLAGAWEFVQRLPKGLESPMGEQGALFSGGQRQRIAIARALVTRPSVLILDEVTTALDPETEREICQTLAGLAGEVTILAISHQRAIQEVAGRSFILRRGEISPTPLGAPV